MPRARRLPPGMLPIPKDEHLPVSPKNVADICRLRMAYGRKCYVCSYDKTRLCPKMAQLLNRRLV